MWCCPKCERYQCQVCRVKNTVTITDNLIITKARKTYLTCKFHNYRILWNKIGPNKKKFVNIKEGKAGAEINIKELR